MRWIATLAGVLMLLSASCAAPKPKPKALARFPSGAYLIPMEASDNARFCIEVPFQPPYDPSQVGLHCVYVADVRRWMGPQLVTEP